MFIASKLLTFATQPLAWAMLLLLAGLLVGTRRPRGGKRLLWSGLLVLFLTGWQAPPDYLLRQLESQNPPFNPQADLKPYVGIVVLGGAMDRADIWKFPGQIALNGAAERVIVPVGLLKHHPHLKMLFTGGSDTLVPETLTEADRAKIFFDSMDVDAAKVTYESCSRTTFENALFSAQLPGVDKHQPWLLLTTASHMPRSLGVFRKTGWNVTPYSVDYRTPDDTAWLAYSIELGVQKWHYALHEIIGYWAYRLSGKI
jgi:uncharacterized SAM-binding protein YcdF (DUF218 family)